ncbi:MAG: hypothetical protein ACK5MI_09025 [Mangrovibacterium sp.]
MTDFKNIKKIRKISDIDSGFKMPDDYFETLEDRLEMRIQAFEAEEKPHAKFIRIVKPILALAACFILVLLLFKYPAQQISQNLINAGKAQSAYDMAEFEAGMYLGDASLADLIMLDNLESTDESDTKDSDAILSELTCYVSDLDVISGMMNE